MKISEIIVDVWTSNAEDKFLSKLDGSVQLNTLSDHNQVIANNLIRRGILDRTNSKNPSIKKHEN